MIRIVKVLLFSILLLSLLSCDSVNDNNPSISGGDGSSKSDEWLVPTNEVFDGGPGKDGIPALEDPELITVSEVNFLIENDLVIIIHEGSEIRIYPHSILDWHEIINDKIGDKAFAITYCPLTGSGISWDRFIDGTETTFGVSGLLYNTNLIPYDRKTSSNWSQMRLQSINGELISTFIETYPIIETSWKTAKELFPNASVVSTNTGYSRSYWRYPYGDYRTNHSSLIFPVNNNDGRLNAKERVLGVFGDNIQKAYRIMDFQSSSVFIDSIGTEKYLIYGNNNDNLINAFKLTQEYSDFDFSISSDPLPMIVEDDKGNHYDIFGISKDPSKSNLIPAKSFIAYWFAWAAFYPGTYLYEM